MAFARFFPTSIAVDLRRFADAHSRRRVALAAVGVAGRLASCVTPLR